MEELAQRTCNISVIYIYLYMYIYMYGRKDQLEYWMYLFARLHMKCRIFKEALNEKFTWLFTKAVSPNWGKISQNFLSSIKPSAILTKDICKRPSGFLSYLIWPVRVTSEIFLLLKSKTNVYAFFPGMDSSVILKFVPKSTSISGMWTSLVRIFLSLLYLRVSVASCWFTPGK